MSLIEHEMNKYIDCKMRTMHTAMPCVVDRIVGNNADVRTIVTDIVILSVPILSHVAWDINVGSRVLVVFAERPEDSRLKRSHSLDDGYIVGVIP